MRRIINCIFNECKKISEAICQKIDTEKTLNIWMWKKLLFILNLRSCKKIHNRVN